MRAEAMIARKDYPEAQQELQADAGKERETRIAISKRAHPLSAWLLPSTQSGNKSDASQHYRLALNLMDEMQKDAGAEKLLDRADLKFMFTEATRFAADQE